MGQGNSAEVELMQDVAALIDDSTHWKTVLERFLQQPPTSAFYKCLSISSTRINNIVNIGTDVLQMMCVLLITQKEDENQHLLLYSIAKLLSNPHLYRQLYKDANAPVHHDKKSPTEMEGTGILRLQKSERLFSFTKYILQPILSTYTNKSVLRHSLKMVLDLLRGKVVVRIPTGDEDNPIKEEVHQLADTKDIENMQDLFASCKGFDMLAHILDHYTKQDNYEGEIGEIRIMDIFFTFSEHMPSETSSSISTITLLSFLFNTKSAPLNYNSNILSTLLPIAHHEHPVIRQKAIVTLLNISVIADSAHKAYLQDCAAASGGILEQLLLLTQSTQTQDSELFSLALLKVFIGDPRENSANARFVSKLLPQSLYYALLRNMEYESSFAELRNDYNTADLVWNGAAREHFKQILEDELNSNIRPFSRELKERRISDVEWKYIVTRARELSIDYEDVLDEIYIRGKFIRHVLEGHEQFDFASLTDDLFERLITEENNENRALLLRYLLTAMTRGRCTAIEHVTYVTKYLLSPKHFSYTFAEEALMLLRTVTENPDIALQFYTEEGLTYLMYHLESIHHKYCLSEEADNIPKIVLCMLQLLSVLIKHPRISHTILASRNFFQCIVKSILINDINVINATVVLLRTLLESVGPISILTAKVDTSKLFETGIFEFIVRQMRLGCSESTAAFLKFYHNIQRFDRGGDDQSPSYLSYFLPMQFINILDKSNTAVSPTSIVGVASVTGTSKTGIELFTEAINQLSVATGPINPYMMWSNEHCDKMIEHADNLIQPFISNLRSAKDGEFVNYTHVKPKRIVFQDVTNELCVKNVFVKRLLHEQSQMVDDPEELLSGLIEEMGNKDHTWENISYMIQAQAKLYHYRHYEHPFTSTSNTIFLKYPAYDTLCNRIEEYVRTDPSDYALLVHATNLLAIMFECPEEYSRHNKLLFVYKHKGLWHMCEWLLHNNADRVLKKEYRQVVVNIIRIMTAQSTTVTPTQETTEEKGIIPDTYFADMSSFLSNQWMEEDASVSQRAIECIRHHVRSHIRGVHKSISATLSMLNVAVLYNDIETEVKNKVCLTAIDTLRTIAQVNSQNRTDTIISVLEKCLTHNIFVILVTNAKDNQTFANFVRKTVRHPLYIWNDTTRTELETLIEKLRGKSEIEMVDVINKFSYSTSEPVLSVRDYSHKQETTSQLVYIGAFNECWKKLKPKSLSAFLHETCSSATRAISDLSFIQSLFNSLNEDLQSLGTSNEPSLFYQVALKTDALRLIFSATPSSKNYKQSLLFVVVDNQSYMSVLVHVFHQVLNTMGKNSTHREAILSNLLSIFFIIAQHHMYVLQQFDIASDDEYDEDAHQETTKAVHLFMNMFVSMTHKLIQYVLGSEEQHTDLLLLSIQLLNEIVNSYQRSVLQLMYTSGLTLTILYIMTGETLKSIENAQLRKSLRSQAARLIGSCCPSQERMSPSEAMLIDLLSYKFKQYLRSAYESPDLLLFYYDENHDTPVTIWNDNTRQVLVDFLSKIVKSIRLHFFPVDRTIVHVNYTLSADFMNGYEQPTLVNELKVGSIFIRCFNENPTFKIWSNDAPRLLPPTLDHTSPSVSPLHFLQQLLSFQFTYTQGKEAKKIVEATLWKSIHNLVRFHNLFASESQIDEWNVQTLIFNRALYPMVVKRVLIASQQLKHKVTTDHQPDISNSTETENLEMNILDDCLAIVCILSQKSTRSFVEYLVALDERSGDSCVATFLHILEKSKENAQRVALLLQLIINLVVSDARFVTMEIVLYCIKHMIETTNDENRERCAELVLKMVNTESTANANLGRIICEKLLTKGFLPQFERQPAQFISFFFADHLSMIGNEEVAWNTERRTKLLEFLTVKVNELEAQFEPQ